MKIRIVLILLCLSVCIWWQRGGLFGGLLEVVCGI